MFATREKSKRLQVRDFYDLSQFFLIFLVTKNSSSYWEGKADAESLQRVYGISFPDAKMLKEWQKFQVCLLKIILRKYENNLFFPRRRQRLATTDALAKYKICFTSTAFRLARVFSCRMVSQFLCTLELFDVL
jgi:hypothetical protein